MSVLSDMSSALGRSLNRAATGLEASRLISLGADMIEAAGFGADEVSWAIERTTWDAPKQHLAITAGLAEYLSRRRPRTPADLNELDVYDE